MASWHQLRAGLPKLSHPTKWVSYNPIGPLAIMIHESAESCAEYCKRTGNIALAPDNLITNQGDKHEQH